LSSSFIEKRAVSKEDQESERNEKALRDQEAFNFETIKENFEKLRAENIQLKQQIDEVQSLLSMIDEAIQL
jgi:hypothetical protein